MIAAFKLRPFRARGKAIRKISQKPVQKKPLSGHGRDIAKSLGASQVLASQQLNAHKISRPSQRFQNVGDMAHEAGVVGAKAGSQFGARALEKADLERRYRANTPDQRYQSTQFENSPDGQHENQRDPHSPSEQTGGESDQLSSIGNGNTGDGNTGDGNNSHQSDDGSNAEQAPRQAEGFNQKDNPYSDDHMNDDGLVPHAEILLRSEMADLEPGGLETLLFKQLPRPRLSEQSAADLTAADARAYAEQSKRFFAFQFPLFSSGDLFYEEVEEDFLHKALGRDVHSVDQRFLDVMTLFRLTLNDNTRSMMLLWMPLIFLLSLLGGAWFSLAGISASLFEPPFLSGLGDYKNIAGGAFGYVLASLAGLFTVYLLYSWPFKVVQQRNLMNLDNYITSKFGRINHNFQVAKRRAFNVERNKRMVERDDLKEEAAAWTLSYQWFALRLFLCELTIRNKFYQIRRNTVLYWTGALVLCGAMLGAAELLTWMFAPSSLGAMVGIAIGGAVFILVAASFLWRISAMMLRVVESHEWNRFHLIGLDQAIGDHAGEDKVQIVTFRDRNRME